MTVWQNALQKRGLTASSLSLRPSISGLKVVKSALLRHFTQLEALSPGFTLDRETWKWIAEDADLEDL